MHETRPGGHQRSSGSTVEVRRTGTARRLARRHLGRRLERGGDGTRRAPTRLARIPGAPGTRESTSGATRGSRSRCPTGRRRRRPARGHRTPTPRRRARGRGGTRTRRCDRGASPPGRRSGAGRTCRRSHQHHARAGRDPSVGVAYGAEPVDNAVDDTPSTDGASTFALPEGTKLQRGEGDPALIEELQQALSKAGYDPGPADGTFGRLHGSGCRRIPGSEWSLRRRSGRPRDRVRAEQCRRGRLTPPPLTTSRPRCRSRQSQPGRPVDEVRSQESTSDRAVSAIRSSASATVGHGSASIDFVRRTGPEQRFDRSDVLEDEPALHVGLASSRWYRAGPPVPGPLRWGRSEARSRRSRRRTSPGWRPSPRRTARRHHVLPVAHRSGPRARAAPRGAHRSKALPRSSLRRPCRRPDVRDEPARPTPTTCRYRTFPSRARPACVHSGASRRAVLRSRNSGLSLPAWVSYGHRDRGRDLSGRWWPPMGGRWRSPCGAIPTGSRAVAARHTGVPANRWPDEDLYRRLGVCLVTHDRAGYGRSDRRHGRRVADEAADVVVLADHLAFERFGVTGASGGGPRALACAALLPDRVVRAACVVGGAPLGSARARAGGVACGAGSRERQGVRLGNGGRGCSVPELERELAEMAARVAVDPSTVLGNFELSEADHAQLARTEHLQIVRESITELAATGVAGWVDDDLAFVKPWGFAVDQIAVRVLVRYGATDVLVPRPTASGWPRTSPAASSRSTARRAASDPTPWRR